MSTDTRSFHLVDVFAEEKYAGNQLAVFENGHLYSEEEMRRLAKEFNFSEITFLFPHDNREGRYRVRIFTPREELPFAGHPTLGTAFVIATQLAETPPAEVVLDLKAGAIPVAITSENGAITRLTMKQLPPTFGGTVDSALVSAMLGLPAEDLDARFPAQEVSTGVPFLMVPLRDRAALERIRVDPAAVARALEGHAANAVLVFCPECYEPGHDLNARVFVDYIGVPEDPATGSANGCLTGYLLQHRYFGSDTVDIQVEQGYQMGRKSLLYLNGRRSGDSYTIFVGGKVQLVGAGRLP